jgi:hypothetical protein
VIKFLYSGLYVCNCDPVNRYDRGRQIDVGHLTDDSGSFQIKAIVAPFERLSSKQSPRDLLLRRAKQPRCSQFCFNCLVLRASTQSLKRMKRHLKPTQDRLCFSGIHFITKQHTVIMNTPRNDQTVLPAKRHSGLGGDSLNALEFISIPVGSFAGTLERILRIRDGKQVPADTGDQGGGQN